MTIGEKISQRRKELHLTLEDIGKAVGVGKSTVKKWESGYIANMRRDKIASLAKILQMSPTEFVNDESKYDVQDKNLISLTSDETMLLGFYRNFNKSGKENLMRYAADLSEMEKYKKSPVSQQDVG